MDELFPKIQRSIETLIEDEEGNIPGNKLLALGTMILILGTLFPLQAFADHRSHSSHKSHSSHSSGSGGGHVVLEHVGAVVGIGLDRVLDNDERVGVAGIVIAGDGGSGFEAVVYE